MVLYCINFIIWLYIGKKITSFLLDHNQSARLKRIFKIKKTINTKKEEYPVNEIKLIDDEELLKIIDTIEAYFNNSDLNNFHYNIKNLKIRKLENLDKYALSNSNEIVGGGYSPYKNEIVVGNDYPALSHEMLHVASTNNRHKHRNLACGFHQFHNFKLHIGQGITEGYTEYLNQIIFSDKDSIYSVISCIYKFESIISRAIEDIIGKEKMNSLYLNADLKGLYNSLSYYLSEKEIDKLIIGMDNFNRFQGKTDIEEISKLLYKSCMEVILLINKALIIKIKDENYDDTYIYRYFINMNNIKEVLLYLDENRYKDIISFIDEQEDCLYDFLKEYDIDVSKDEIKEYKEYHIINK